MGIKSKILVLFFTAILTTYGLAQFKTAVVGIDGLTCSACSNATEQSILKLEFVEFVVMDLNNNSAYVVFKKDRNVEIEKLAEKVYDAGFTVRSMDVIFYFDKEIIKNQECFEYAQKEYFIVNPKETALNGEKTLKFIAKKMMTKIEFKQYKAFIKYKCEGLVNPDYYVKIN
jgi:copper chaperone CopZ